METFIAILMATIAIIYLSLFFKDIEDGYWNKTTDQELLAGVLGLVVAAFMLLL